MRDSIEEKLEKLAFRLDELRVLLSSEGAVENIQEYRERTREYSDIEHIVASYRDYRSCKEELSSVEELVRDPEMGDYARQECESLKVKLLDLENVLQRSMLPKDPNDTRNIFLEIRAGTGGDESALFAGDLFRMYSRYAEKKGWKVEIISHNQSDLGGFKEIILKVLGDRVFERLKFESGGHRVQRVPDTETQGRVHTSACTVAIMPEADQIEEVKISPSDIRVDTFRASGAGGQHVNKTDSAIRITHNPTGIVVECQEDRSQHKNRAQAMSVLAARLHDLQIRHRQSEEAATRKSMIGSGDRSERIRTYNFPQGRITDHRINLTLYKLSQVLEGDLDELIAALQAEYQAELLAGDGE